MRGFITPLVICGLAATPFVCAICRVPRQWFIGLTAVVGTTALAGYIAFAGLGYRFTENLTTSLNGYLYAYKPGAPFKKGDLVAYHWHGGFNYARGSIFIKKVVGVPGDEVRRDGRTFFVAGRYIGLAKPNARTGEALEATAVGVIPDGAYFLATPSPDSLDSRYAATGNVMRSEIIGKAYELF